MNNLPLERKKKWVFGLKYITDFCIGEVLPIQILFKDK